jgi:hypothetical protein
MDTTIHVRKRGTLTLPAELNYESDIKSSQGILLG